MSEWLTTTLGEVVEMSSGGTPSMKTAAYWDGQIPWISSSSLKSNRLNRSDRMVTTAAIGNGTKIAPKGSILIVVRGMSLWTGIRVGKAVIDVAFNQDVKALNAHPCIDSDFLLYTLEGRASELMAMVRAATNGTGVLPTELLSAVQVALPPLAEQHRIVAVMSAVDAQIGYLAAELLMLTKLTTAAIESTVDTAAQSTLGDVLLGIHGGRSPQATGVPPSLAQRGVLKVSAVRTQRFLPEESKVLTDSTEMPPRSEVVGGDLLITRANTPLLVGQVCRVPANVRGGLYLSDKTLRLVPDPERADPDYLVAVLALPLVREWLGGSATGTSASMVNISQAKIKQTPIPLHDLAQQRAIAKQVGSLLNLTELLTRELGDLRVVRTDLLSALLSQEITVDAAVDQFVKAV